MKKKILIIISIILVMTAVFGVVIFSIKNYERDRLNQSLQTVKTETAVAKAEQKKKELKSTADEITNLEREINETKQRTDEGYNKIINTALSYIDILYNYDGDLNEQKNSIIENLKKITEETFLKNQVEPLFMRSGGNMSGKTSKHTRTDNFCTVNDVYVATDEYDDGSDVHLVICALHYGNNTLYRELSIVQMEDNSYKVNYDGPMTSSRTKLGGS